MWSKTSKNNCFLATFVVFSGYSVGAEKQTDDDIYSMTMEELLGVKVSTATKNEQSIAEAPSIISVLSAQEIKEAGITTLFDALRLIPGFSPLNQLKGDQLMVVRGIGLRDGVLVLIDGVPVNDALEGRFDFYSRTLDDIERIEVIRGPGSALYGSYAVSSVIQLFTKKPGSQKERIELKVGAGSFDEKQFKVSFNDEVTSLSPDLKVSVSFSYFDNKGDELPIVQDAIFTPVPGRFLPPLLNPTLTPTIRQAETEKYNGHVNLSYKDFSLGFVHSQIISNPILSHLGIVTEPGKTIRESTQDVFSLTHHWRDLASWEVTSKFYAVLNESKLFGQSQPPQIRGDEDQDGLNENFPSGIIENFQHKTQSLGIDIAATYEFSESHQWLIGATFDSTELKEVHKTANVSLAGRGPIEIFPARDMTSEFMPQDIKRDFNALYLQDSWQVNNKVQVTTGIRFGDYSDFGSTLNPRLGIVYRVTDAVYSKLLYGQAFKPPAFSQLFDATPTLSANRRRGNANLQPTEINSIEWQVGYEFSSTMVSSLTFFNNETSNEIFFNATSGIEQWQNAGERRSRGAEVEFRGQFAGLDYVNFNYSYQKTTGVDTGAGANIHSPHRFNAYGAYEFNDWQQLGFGFSFYSSPEREEGDDRAKVGSKRLVYLNLQSKNVFTHGLDFTLTVSNLLDDDGRDEIEASIGLLDDIPIEGRKIQAFLSYTFD
ncbi:TonB-dependent siderophore receptor [Pleionea sp. CnH1-48]|uniref:TonB-dependent receptor plug domain-containing protein n=1 Tax=Pleionea sp. CnH1-48 TaxID=2954494 RepID=UPI0020970DE5|nr:TonB-dependent receptor [Pleionea sp. CnH1-48]MCO7224760.1 TonB-dependent receptor [Pleionea sp. CnH1-48]